MTAAAYTMLLDGSPASEIFSAATVEVEENLDTPSAFQIRIGVGDDGKGDLSLVGERRVRPFSKVSIVVTPIGQRPHCIFDGVVLSQRLHLEQGGHSSHVEIWGEDGSWLMNLEEKIKEWSNVTDASVASSIFGDYNITPAPANMQDDSAAHIETRHTLMQRASDIQFLRMLARRSGKLCWIACTDLPGRPTGYFMTPSVSGAPAATLSIAPSTGNVAALDFEWDVAHPSAVRAEQATLDGQSASVNATDSGLPTLADRDLSTFAERSMTVVLTAAVDDSGELDARAKALLRESGWFVRCRGEADLARLGTVLRAGSIVRVDAAGKLNSGKYFVWSVRHTITLDAHRMAFQLVRNSVGPASTGGGFL